MNYPLVTAIMPTTAKRKKFLPQALRCWLEQSYSNTELVIVTEDDLSDVIPDHPKIKLVKCAPGLTIGHKRNIACENSAGTHICTWDDDDWSFPRRIEEMMTAFKNYETAIAGYHTVRLFDTETKIARSYNFRHPGNLPQYRQFVHGCSLTYTKSFWKNNKFADVSLGEDNIFIRGASPVTIKQFDGDYKMVMCEHGSNTSKREYSHWTVVGSHETEAMLNSYPATKVIMTMLTWNRADVALENLEALKKETWRLNCFGYDAQVLVCDNASSDDTVPQLKKQKGITKIFNKENIGQALARNQLIDYAVKEKADYVLFTDCDVTIIPGSVLEMLKWYRTHGAVSIGASPFLYTEDITKVPKWLGPLEQYNLQVSPCLTITGYGLFTVPVLAKYKFDEHFGCGWGFEDNDLAMTIENETGLVSYRFEVPFLHRQAHSSIKLNQLEGVDMDKNILERSQYVVKKWQNNPKFAHAMEWMRHVKGTYVVK